MTTRAEPQLLHPDDELLVAYLTEPDLAWHERGVIERHLADCDRCVGALAVALTRLDLAAEIPLAVPAMVSLRAEAAVHASPVSVVAPTPAPVRHTPASDRGWLTTLRDGFASLTRMPVLVPASFAVGALMMLTTDRLVNPTVPQPLTRSVDVDHSRRVTAADAVVRAQPSTRAEAVARLTRGQIVEINGEEKDWYRAVLPGGTEGWVERRAFE